MAPPGVLEISRADSYAGPAVAGTPGRLGRLGVGLQHRTLFPLAHIVGKPGSVHQCLEAGSPITQNQTTFWRTSQASVLSVTSGEERLPLSLLTSML